MQSLVNDYLLQVGIYAIRTKGINVVMIKTYLFSKFTGDIIIGTGLILLLW